MLDIGQLLPGPGNQQMAGFLRIPPDIRSTPIVTAILSHHVFQGRIQGGQGDIPPTRLDISIILRVNFLYPDHLSRSINFSHSATRNYSYEPFGHGLFATETHSQRQLRYQLTTYKRLRVAYFQHIIPPPTNSGSAPGVFHPSGFCQGLCERTEHP